MLFDSHCHLNFSSFKDEYRNIIVDCLNKEIGVINIGSQIDTSRKAIEIANQYINKNIYASIGLHPIHSSNLFDQDKYQELVDNNKSKIIAIGEIGLDYFHSLENKTLQKQVFIQQLDFAEKNDLPIILHARGSQENPQDAYLDILEILSSPLSSLRRQGSSINGVIHCFGSNLEIAQKFIDLGFYIGFTGIVTFKNKSVQELQKVVKKIPLNKILIETDAPYLTPEPYRGEKNKPQYVEFVARKIAEIKETSYEEVCNQTTENVKKLFNI